MPNDVTSGLYINDLFFWCNNVTKIKEFYNNILQLPLKWEGQSESGRPFVVFELANTQKLHFMQHETPIDIIDRWAYQPSSEIAGGSERPSWTFLMEKNMLQEILQRLIDAEIPMLTREIEDRGEYSALTVRDPMGNTIDLCYNH